MFRLFVAKRFRAQQNFGENGTFNNGPTSAQVSVQTWLDAFSKRSKPHSSKCLVIINLSAWLSALTGGVLLGLAATLLLWSHGKVAGISGIVGSGLLDGGKSRSDAVPFLVGLFLPGIAAGLLMPSLIGNSAVGTPGVIAAGLLVGYGTRLGSGCTSGHGICGISRLSPRSLVATATFMATGAATVWIMKNLVGGV